MIVSRRLGLGKPHLGGVRRPLLHQLALLRAGLPALGRLRRQPGAVLWREP